ncbi:hypothetical protein [Streptomyces sp. NPDC048392]|uniref:hypothetical protein n=1 Tax=Streptomyces sp. NPDC048392 TaxID=3365543 RepID=UPI0037143547
MQDRTPKPVPERPDEPLRGLLEALREALDVPHPATLGDAKRRDQILVERAAHAMIALDSILIDDAPLGIEWTTRYLRERLAEHPATGYTTWDQARAARGPLAGGEGR